MLDVFDFSNTQLGDTFAVYGVVAMLAYFPGGPIADRFSPRVLLTISLLATAAGGLLMAQIPGPGTMAILYGYWGLTTIFLFWAALIRATREWGGELSQGRAFGLLDGGRGLVAAGSATVAVYFLAQFLPADIATTSDQQREEGLRAVIYLYSGITAFAALLTWFCLPIGHAASGHSGGIVAGIREVMARPVSWAIAGVVVCAYCTYKGLDNYSLYAVQVLGMNELEAADFTSRAAYLRILGAIGAGMLADRFLPSKVVLGCFAGLVVSYLLLATSEPGVVPLTLIFINLVVSFLCVFALRGVYFALMGETGTPVHLTGTTVGVVSVLGFTPEIFFAPIAGRILDASPGAPGHLDYFAMLAAIAVAGLLVSVVVLVYSRRHRTEVDSRAT